MITRLFFCFFIQGPVTPSVRHQFDVSGGEAGDGSADGDDDSSDDDDDEGDDDDDDNDDDDAREHQLHGH